MAGGGVVASSSGARASLYTGRLTSYVLWACLVAASGGLLFGFDIGVTGGVTSMPDFLRKMFPHILHQHETHSSKNAWCAYDDQLLQLFTSSLFIAGLFGGLAASYTTSHWGRVRTMFMSGCFFLAGAVLTASAPVLAVLVAGRIFLGLGVGFANQAVPLYLSEMAPAAYRGALNQAFQMATTIGILVAQLINYGTQHLHPWGWRLSLAGAGVPAIILFLGGIFLPETPNSLIERGLLEEGRAELVKIRGNKDVEVEYEDLLSASQRAAQISNPFANILKRENRPELFFAIVIPLFQQLTGINAIMFYVAPLFNTLGFGESAALYSAVITGGVNVVATLVSIFTVDRLGRRMLFFVGGVQMICMQVATGFILKAAFGNGDKQLSSGISWLVVACICVYVAGFAWSWGPLGWLVPSEIQPLETRSAGQSITVATNFLFTFGVGQAFLTMLCGMQYGIFLFFGGCVVVMTAVIYFLLPETSGLPLEDMVAIWTTHWFWRRYTAEAKRAAADTDVELRHGAAAAAAAAPRAASAAS
eukprot:jgi/Mesen1/10909/ME000095S10247